MLSQRIDMIGQSSDQASTDETVWLDFEGPRRPIRVRAARAVVPQLAIYLPDWPRRMAPVSADCPVDVAVETSAEQFRVTEANPPRAETDCFDAAHAALVLLGALISCYVAQDATLICLHAATCQFDRGLVVMMGETMAGKSTLAAHFALHNARLFGDDRLAVRLSPQFGDAGICLAIPYKLRLPPPPDAEEGFENFVEAHLARRWEHMVQLRLGLSQAAPFGEACPIQALILLDRGPRAEPALERVAPGEIATALIRHGFAPHLATGDLVRAFVALAERVPGYRMRYQRSVEGAALVLARFAAQPQAARQ
jgi:hypothetical protein